MDTNLYKLGVKLFVAKPDTANLAAFVPVFHRWIQQQCIAGHLLLDVHDYSHVREGPGILLVAHEGNFSIDQSEGRLGLVYYRKRPLAGDFSGRLKSVLSAARQAAHLLETEPKLNGLRFRADELAVFANDRLLAPNTPAALAEFQPLLAGFFGKGATLTARAPDPRERLTVTVKLPRTP